MRNVLAGLTLAAALGFGALPTAAAPFGVGGVERLGNGIEQVQWNRSRCDRLRSACRNRDERGERGEGNCRRYREQCKRWWN
jgi:hypothetical protein